MASTNLSSQQTLDLFHRYVIPNYTRYPVNLVRGQGSVVWDSEGREYLDFFPGWGCNLLGHCPPRIVEAIQQQVATLIHVPNTWHMQSQGLWAQMLVERCFDGQAFFCNSGAEANEAAIKLRDCTSPLRLGVPMLQDHYLSRWIPRENLRCLSRHGTAQIPCRSRSHAGRFHLCSLWRAERRGTTH